MTETGASSGILKNVMIGLDELQPGDSDSINQVIRENLPKPVVEPNEDFRGWIKSISIEGVRSYGPKQTLELSRGLTVIYAENGTGKTSSVDAVELMVHGETTRSTLFSKIKVEVKDSKNIPHLTESGEKTEFSPRVIAKWKKSADEDYLETTWSGEWGQHADDPPPIILLARRRLREFINQTGTERAERFGEVLDLAPLIEDWEKIRKDLLNYSKKCEEKAGESRAKAIAFLGEAEFTYFREKFNDGNVRNLDDLEEEIVNRSKELLQEAVSEARGRNDETQEKVSDLVKSAINGPGNDKWSPELSGKIRKLAELDNALISLPTASPDLLRLLELFKEQARADETCAACKNGTVSASRLSEIQNFLDEHKAQVKCRSDITRVRKDILEIFRQVKATATAWNFMPFARTSWQSLGTSTDISLLIQKHNEIEALRENWVQEAENLTRLIDKANIGSSLSEMKHLIEEIKKFEKISEEIEEMCQRAESDRMEVIASGVVFSSPEITRYRLVIQRARSIAVDIDSFIQETARRSVYLQGSSVVKSLLGEAIADKARELEEPINQWRRLLAPDNTPSISAKAKRSSGRTSLSLGLVESAQSVAGRLSDSQLDMIGLAAHFAMIEHQHPGAPVVIDDPTDMLDEPTQEKLVEEGISRLLNGLPGSLPGRQVIVFTHDANLVKLLWRKYGTRAPYMLQSTIELNHDTNPPQSMIRPRSASEYLERTKRLIKDNQASEYQLWLRSTVGNHTRQAVECIVKDIWTVMGPIGLRIPGIDGFPAGISDHKGKTLNNMVQIMSTALSSIIDTYQACGTSRHHEASKNVGTLLDCISIYSKLLLNEASHADYVYPTIGSMKIYLNKLDVLADLLSPLKNGPQDEWVSNCGWARDLSACDQCPQPSKA